MVTRFSAEQHHAEDHKSLGPALRSPHLKRKRDTRKNNQTCYVFFSIVYCVRKHIKVFLIVMTLKKVTLATNHFLSS